MTFSRYLLVLILFLLSCAGNSTKIIETQTKQKPVEIHLSQKLPIAPYITKGKLENGITYYIRKNSKPEKRAELRLVVNAGSILEDSTQQGLAHLLEHMCFNGTEHFKKQELVSFLESVGLKFGPDLNAYTSFDETVYMLQVPTDSIEVFKKGFLVLEDWAHAISLEDEEVDKERGVVIEEWRLGQGANKRMFDKQLPIILKNSKYANRLPIGKKEILETFNYSELRRFYEEWYRPDLMAVVAVGDFDVDSVENLIEQHFSKLNNPQNPKPRHVFSVPDHDEKLYAIASDKEAMFSMVNIYYKKEAKESKTVAEYRAKIVERLFHTMFNSRLYDLSHSENPPFTYAYSGKQRFVRPTEMYTLGAMVKDNGIPTGFESLLTEAKRVQIFGFTENELERAKIKILRGMEKSFLEKDKTDSKRYAAEYIRNFLTDEAISGIEYEYEIYKKYTSNIKLSEVNKLVRELITENNRVIVINSPEKDGITIPDKSTLSSILSKTDTIGVMPFKDEVKDEPLISAIPQSGKIVKEEFIKNIDTHLLILQNGIKVYLKSTDFKNDEIRFSGTSPGGISSIGLDSLIAAYTATGIVNESGVGNFNAIQLRKKLTGKIVSVHPYISGLSEGFSGSASPKDLETMFQLIYLYFNTPREDSTAFKTFTSRLETFYQNNSVNPEAAYRDTIATTMTSNNPRYRPFNMESLAEMDLQKSLSIYKNRFADAGDFTFFFIGNLPEKRIKKLIETYLCALKTTGRNESWSNETYSLPIGIIKKSVKKGIEPKGNVSIIFSGTYNWNVENNSIMNSLKEVLNIKLRERLREDKGGTYGVRLRTSLMHYPKERYKFTINFGCEPARVNELINEVFTQIDSLQSYGLATDYLAKTKEISMRSYQKNLKENRYWVSNLEFAYFHGLNIDYILEINKITQKRTMKEVQEAAQKYLKNDNFVQVVLYPENMN